MPVVIIERPFYRVGLDGLTPRRPALTLRADEAAQPTRCSLRAVAEERRAGLRLATVVAKSRARLAWPAGRMGSAVRLWPRLTDTVRYTRQISLSWG